MPIYKYIDKTFFKVWSCDMAYILGFLYADGSITITKRGTKYFALHSMDSDILKKIKKCLNAQQVISKRTVLSGQVYRLQVGSRDMVEDLIVLGLDTVKAARMKFPIVPGDVFGSFVRGYFDGDGNVWVGDSNTKRAKHVLKILTAFTSASYTFLRELKMALQREGIEGGSLYYIKNKECSRLSFSKLDSLKLYKIMYNGMTSNSLYLSRKKKVFDAFIKKMRT